VFVLQRSLKYQLPSTNTENLNAVSPVADSGRVVAALFAAPIWLEVVIVGSNLFYAWLLIKLARRGEDALPVVKFGAARHCRRSGLVALC